MAVFAKGADPEALERSATNFAGYARTCDEVRQSIGDTAAVIRANWAGGDLQALAGRVPAVQQQLAGISHTLDSLGQRLSANARAQQVTSGATGGLPGAPYGGGGPGGEPGGGPGGEPGGEHGGEWEKPTWLEVTEKTLKPIELTTTGMGVAAYGLFSHTAGGSGFRNLFDNGKLLDLYTEDAMRAVDTTKGLTAFENAGTGINSAVKALDGRYLGSLFEEGSRASGVAGKLGVLGPISIAAGTFSTVEDIIHGDAKNAVLDGTSTALTAGALLAPPPADLVCGAGALGIAAYQNIPAVHAAVDGVVHGAEDVAKGVGHAASSAWHAITSIF